MKSQKIPDNLQPVLWSVDVKNLDIHRDKGYIIHQVLHIGSIDDIKWLIQVYGKEKIRELFLQRPSKNYFRKDFYFVKNYILGLKNKSLNEEDYVTSVHGKIRQRATRSL